MIMRIKSMAQLLVSPYLFLSLYVLFLYLYNFKLAEVYLSPFHPVFILWGLVTFYINIVRTGIWRTLPYKHIVVLIVVSMMLSGLVNYQHGLIAAVKSIVLSFMSYAVVFGLAYQVISRRKGALSSVVVILLPTVVTVIVSLAISLGMYFYEIGGILYIDGAKRLYGAALEYIGGGNVIVNISGVMKDTNHMSVYGVIALGLMVIYLRNIYLIRNKVLRYLSTALLIMGILITVIALSLLNSRGSQLALVCTLILLVPAGIMSVLHEVRPKWNRYFAAAVALPIGVLAGAAVYFADLSIRSTIYDTTNPLDNRQSTIIYKDGEFKKSHPEMTSGAKPNNSTSSTKEVSAHASSLAPKTTPSATSPTVKAEKQDWSGELAGTGNGRTLIWSEALGIFLSSPLFGVGTDNRVAYAEANNIPIKWTKRWPNAHNSYIDVAIDYGIIGLGLVLALIGSVIVRHIVRAYDKNRAMHIDTLLVLGMVVYMSLSAGLLSLLYHGINSIFAIYMILLAVLVYELKVGVSLRVKKG